MAIVVAGCSLLGPQDGAVPNEPTTSGDVSDRWVIATQGEDKPKVCQGDLSHRQAREEAQKALKSDEEAQALQQSLERMGKRTMAWRARGCKVASDESSSDDVSGSAASEDDLVEIPAGANTALYIHSSEDDAANVWMTHKQSVGGGVWLDHTEAALEEEQGGLSGAGTGTGLAGYSLFVPDQQGRQELADEVFNLMSDESSDQAQSSSVEASGIDTRDKTMRINGQSVDWSQARVLIIDEDPSTPEARALIVVPPEGTSSESLLGGFGGGGLSSSTIAQSTHVSVPVTRSVPPSTSRFSFGVNRSMLTSSTGGFAASSAFDPPEYEPEPPEPEPKPKPEPEPEPEPDPEPDPPEPTTTPGDELPEAHEKCPVKVYPTLKPFERELCAEYGERWEQKRWEQKVRPKLHEGVSEVHNKVRQTLEQRSRNNSASGVAYFPDPKMGVLTAGLGDLDPETIKRLREIGLNEDYLQEDLGGQSSNVSVDFCYGLPGIDVEIGDISIGLNAGELCLRALLDITTSFQQWAEDNPSLADELSNQLQSLVACANGDECDFDNQWRDITSSHNAAFEKFVTSLVETLKAIGLPASTAESSGSLFVKEFLQTISEDQVEWMVKNFGPTVVTAVSMEQWMSEEGRLNPDGSGFDRFPYATADDNFDLLSFMHDIKAMLDYSKGHRNEYLLKSDLNTVFAALAGAIRAGAAPKSGSIGSDVAEAREKLYRVQVLTQMAVNLKDRSGWEVQRLWRDLRDVSGAVDIIATGTQNGTDFISYILIEPHLESADLGGNPDRVTLGERLIETAEYATDSTSGIDIREGNDPVIVIAIEKADTGTLDQLIQRINSMQNNHKYRKVTFIIVKDGAVVHKKGPKENVAEQLCDSMGLCDQPETDPSSEQDSDNDDSSVTVTGVVADDCDSETSTAKLCAQAVQEQEGIR